jgi:hypothetical protein
MSSNSTHSDEQDSKQFEAKEPATVNQLVKARACADVIKFRVDGELYHDKPSARAGPNQRLVSVFGIDNAFTTYDSAQEKRFVQHTKNLMKNACKLVEEDSGGDWTGLCRSVTSHCTDYLRHQEDINAYEFNLVELVQYITLKTSLCYLFDDADAILASGHGFEDITYIGRRINELWIESKRPDEGMRSLWTEEKELHNALRRVTTRTPDAPPHHHGLEVPVANVWTWPGALWRLASGYLSGLYAGFRRHLTWSKDSPTPTLELPEPTIPSRNPMNLLLPAYETMWRVVLRCFLEIHHRGADNGNAWSDILTGYLRALYEPEMQTGSFLR